MDAFEDQDQVDNPFRGCQIGACFACGLGVLPADNGQQDANTTTPRWQSDRINPLPAFPMPNGFYTPILLPGPYLPLDLFVPEEIEDGIIFYTMEDPELAEQVVAFLGHELFHMRLLHGVIPNLMRLLASRCYGILAWLTTDGYNPLLWQQLLTCNNNIDNIFQAIAPFHEVVANLGDFIGTNKNNYTSDITHKSLSFYSKAYGKDFLQALNDFCDIMSSLQDWFAQNLLDLTYTTLAEYILLGTIEWWKIGDDVFNVPSTIPKKDLRNHIKRFGIPYLNVSKKSPIPVHCYSFVYKTYPILGRLQYVKEKIQKAGVKKARVRRGKNSLDSAIEQILYIAKAVPDFHIFLQNNDKLYWLKRRISYVTSDLQEILKTLGFDLPLIEIQEFNMSPLIFVSYMNKSTNDIMAYAFGREREYFSEKMRKRILSENFVAYDVQSNKPLGIWYAPGCNKVTHVPITPTTIILHENSGVSRNLLNRLHNLSVFESIRSQIALGKGISCPLLHQYDSECCGLSKLLWSIYEAGKKAEDEFVWQPKKWEEPECRKIDYN